MRIILKLICRPMAGSC